MATKKSGGYTIGSIYDDLKLTPSTETNQSIISTFPYVQNGTKNVYLYPYSNVNDLYFSNSTRVWLLKDTDDGVPKKYLVFIEIAYTSSFTSRSLRVTDTTNNYFNDCFTTSNSITTVSAIKKSDLYWKFCRWCRDFSNSASTYSLVKFILVDVDDFCTGTATNRTAINVNNLVTPTLTSTSLSFSSVNFDEIKETESYFCYKNYTAASDYYCYKSLPSTQVYDIYIKDEVPMADPYLMDEYTLKEMGAKALNVTLYNAESVDETASHITIDFTKKIVTDKWPLTISLCSSPSTGESIKIIRNTNSNEFSFSGFSAIDSTKVADGIHYQPENQKLKRKYEIKSRESNVLLGDFFSENNNITTKNEDGTFPDRQLTIGNKIDVIGCEGLYSGNTHYSPSNTTFFTDITDVIDQKVVIAINSNSMVYSGSVTYRNLKYTYDADNVYYYDNQSSNNVELSVLAKVTGSSFSTYGSITLREEHCTASISGITIGDDLEVVNTTGIITSYVNVFGNPIQQSTFNNYTFTKSDESESGNFSSFTDGSTTINVFNITGSNDCIAIRNGNLYVKGSNNAYSANPASIIYEKYGITEWLPQIVDLRTADIRKPISGGLSLDKFSSTKTFDALKVLNFFDKISILESTDHGVTLITKSKTDDYTQSASSQLAATGNVGSFSTVTTFLINSDFGVRLSDHIGIGYISTKSFNNGSVPRLTSADGSSRYLEIPTVDGNIVSATLYYNNGNFVFASTSYELIDTGRVVKYQITHNSLPSGSSYVQTALTISEAQYKVVDFDKTTNKFVLTSSGGNVELQCTLGANGAVTIRSGLLIYTSSRFKGFTMNQNGISPESSSWVILPESFTYEFNDNLDTTNYIVCDALTREILTDMTHVVSTTNVFLGKIL